MIEWPNFSHSQGNVLSNINDTTKIEVYFLKLTKLFGGFWVMCVIAGIF